MLKGAGSAVMGCTGAGHLQGLRVSPNRKGSWLLLASGDGLNVMYPDGRDKDRPVEVAPGEKRIDKGAWRGRLDRLQKSVRLPPSIPAPALQTPRQAR